MNGIHAKIFVLMSYLMLWKEIPLHLTLNLSNRLILQPYISYTFTLPTFSILSYLTFEDIHILVKENGLLQVVISQRAADFPTYKQIAL